MDGISAPMYGDGEVVRDWVYIDDHIRALDLIAERGRVGETYNVGGRNERNINHVVWLVCRVLDSHNLRYGPFGGPIRLIKPLQNRPDARHAIDTTKLETELGWTAQETFQTGMAKTVQWYLDNISWWKPLRQSYEKHMSTMGLVPAPKV